MEEYKGMYGHLLISIQQAVGAASNQHTQILRASQAAHEESIQALKVIVIRLNVDGIHFNIERVHYAERELGATAQSGVPEQANRFLAGR
jgi:hypothetical protein